MRYLITMTGKEPFYTSWFDVSNHYIIDSGMIVYDMIEYMYFDGSWHEIQIDHL